MKLKSIAYLFFFLLSAGLSGQQFVVDKIIGKVGSEFILLSEVEDQYAYALTQDPSLGIEIKCQILDNLIAQKLIIYHAKLDSVIVSDEEVEAQLNLRFDNILRQMNGDEEFFKEYYGETVAGMKERFREDQKQQILAERMQFKLINSVTITPEEVKNYYESIPKDSLPYLDSEVELGELVIQPQVSQKEKNIAYEKLADIRAQIVSGEATFEDLALKYSMDPGSAARGGDLGFANRGSYVPEFEAAVFTMTEGELSEIIETEYGFHIIKHLERRGNRVRARHILIKPQLTQNDIDKAKELLDSIRTLIVSDSLSFQEAVKDFGFDGVESYNNDGRMKNRSTGDNFFLTADLDPDVYFAIIDLDIDGITEVMDFKSFNGEPLVRILQLQSITRPHKANLEQDYDKISQYAKESKKAEYFDNWIKEKMNTTYIELKPEYDYCEKLKQYIK